MSVRRVFTIMVFSLKVQWASQGYIKNSVLMTTRNELALFCEEWSFPQMIVFNGFNSFWNCIGYLQNQVLKTRQEYIIQLHNRIILYNIKKVVLRLTKVNFSPTLLKRDKEDGAESNARLKITTSVLLKINFIRIINYVINCENIQKGLSDNYVTHSGWVGLNVFRDVAWRKTRGWVVLDERA